MGVKEESAEDESTKLLGGRDLVPGAADAME